MSRFQLREPGIGFFLGEVQGGGLVGFPGLDCILAQGFAFFLAFDVLAYGLAHQPVWRALARTGQTFDTLTGFGIDLDCDRSRGSRIHGLLH